MAESPQRRSPSPNLGFSGGAQSAPPLGANPAKGGAIWAPDSEEAKLTFFVGPYRVLGEIGVGGMAAVYLGRIDGPGGFQKWVALKRIHPHLVEDQRFVHMFLDEARIAARIQHPHVAQVYDLYLQDKTYWIVMEYLHGESVRELMRRLAKKQKRLPTLLTARLCADAARGIHAAHELKGKSGRPLNLVHRDLTPHNLFLTFDGVTKVVDFGIAKAAERLASTRVGTLKGKIAYMSPEQVRGEDVDRRTDVFALGVVLWELLTQRRLFRAESDIETMERVQACVVPPPSAIIEECPDELETVVLRALTKDKNHRYQNALELARALEAFLIRSGKVVDGSDLSAYLGDIFAQRVSERDAHLAWASEIDAQPVDEAMADPASDSIPGRTATDGRSHEPDSAPPSDTHIGEPPSLRQEDPAKNSRVPEARPSQPTVIDGELAATPFREKREDSASIQVKLPVEDRPRANRGVRGPDLSATDQEGEQEAPTLVNQREAYERAYRAMQAKLATARGPAEPSPLAPLQRGLAHRMTETPPHGAPVRTTAEVVTTAAASQEIGTASTERLSPIGPKVTIAGHVQAPSAPRTLVGTGFTPVLAPPQAYAGSLNPPVVTTTAQGVAPDRGHAPFATTGSDQTWTDEPSFLWRARRKRVTTAVGMVVVTLLILAAVFWAVEMRVP